MPTQLVATTFSVGFLHNAGQCHRTAARRLAVDPRSVESYARAHDIIRGVDVPHAANHAAGRNGSGTAEDDAVHHASAAGCLHVEVVGRIEPVLGRRKHRRHRAATCFQQDKVWAGDARASTEKSAEEAVKTFSCRAASWVPGRDAALCRAVQTTSSEERAVVREQCRVLCGTSENS